LAPGEQLQALIYLRVNPTRNEKLTFYAVFAACVAPFLLAPGSLYPLITGVPLLLLLFWLLFRTFAKWGWLALTDTRMLLFRGTRRVPVAANPLLDRARPDARIVPVTTRDLLIEGPGQCTVRLVFPDDQRQVQDWLRS
jgi:hypothetical protein